MIVLLSNCGFYATEFFIKCFAVTLLLGLILSSCTSANSSFIDPINLAQQQGFKKSLVHSSDLNLLSLQRNSASTGPIHLYIEGDGQAWKTRFIPSDDPTPMEPLALQLALADPSPNVIYLARPCQYTKSAICNKTLWTHARFGNVAIKNMIEAIQQVSLGRPVELIGYSGGGTIALLAAAQLSNIVSIRTVAGNLDPEAHIALHQLAPLTDALNPTNFAKSLADIPQIHFVGSLDDNVPPNLAQGYQNRLANHHCSQIVIVENASHRTGWLEHWPQLLQQPPRCRS